MQHQSVLLKRLYQLITHSLLYGVRNMLNNPYIVERAGLPAGRGLKNRTFVVQGLGNVGYWAAHFIHKAGGKIVAVGEHDGVISNYETGINPNTLRAYIRKSGGVAGYPDGEHQSDADPVTMECDVLVPAALEGVIHRGNVANVRSRLVAEGANGPCTAGADEILTANGVVVLPDLLANAMGVTCSYVEWAKNLAGMRLGRLTKRHSEAQGTVLAKVMAENGFDIAPDDRELIQTGADEEAHVRSGLEDTMVLVCDEVFDMLKSGKVPSLRVAAYVKAIERVAEAYERRGVWP